MKSLSKRIAEDMAKQTASRLTNRAAFLVARSDVEQALDDGWPVKDIWRTLYEEKKISFGYHAFCRYVNRLIVGRRLKVGGDMLPEEKEKGNLKPDQANVDSVDKASAGMRNFDSAPEVNTVQNNQPRGPSQQMGHKPAIHTLLTGGQSRSDTVKDFAQLVSQLPEDTFFIVRVLVPPGTEATFLTH